MENVIESKVVFLIPRLSPDAWHMHHAFKKFTEELGKHICPDITEQAVIDYARNVHGFNPDSVLYLQRKKDAFYRWMEEVFIPHKVAVLQECHRVGYVMGMGPKGILQRAAVHDLSKLSPEELWTWVDVHEAGGPSNYAHKDRLKEAIDHHYRTNDHHPEYWLKGGNPAEMPIEAVYEMVADWAAASQTYGTPLQDWLDANFDKKPLHPTSRDLAKEVLEHVYKITFPD